jgi:mannitol/fructose-specific phosphotransferase system IIA component (Ntr-type)
MRTTNDLFSLIAPDKKKTGKLLDLIKPENITLNLKSKTKEAAINELLDILSVQRKLIDRDIALADLLNREQTMSTGIPNGIALPHAKTSGVQEMTVALCIKKSGLDFDSPLDDKTRIIVLALAPPEKAKPLYQFLLTITAILNNDIVRQELLAAKSPAKIVELLHKYH